MQVFWSSVPDTFPRFENLVRVLLNKSHEHAPFRGIVFVQQRAMTHVLEHLVRSDARLHMFSPACIYAVTSPATAFNMLIATAAAEEGMDIAAANVVICFDVMPHAVALVQRRGRARHDNSSFVVLADSATRSTTMLERTEEEQRGIVRDFQPAPRASGADGGDEEEAPLAPS
jgi:superfamily II DNA/RNA helicase